MLFTLMIYGLFLWFLAMNSYISLMYLLLVMGGLMVIFSFIPMVEFDNSVKNSSLYVKLLFAFVVFLVYDYEVTTIDFIDGYMIFVPLKEGFVSLLLFLMVLFFLMLLVVDGVINTSGSSILK